MSWKLQNSNGHYTQAVIDDGSIMEGELKWDEWVEKYKPIKNHITKYPDPNAEFESFETYGEEWEFVKSQDPKHVWTWIDGDMSSLLVAGIGWINRLSYYVCEVPWEDESQQVLVSVEVECECFDQDRYDEGDEAGDPDCPECEGYGLRTAYVD